MAAIAVDLSAEDTQREEATSSSNPAIAVSFSWLERVCEGANSRHRFLIREDAGARERQQGSTRVLLAEDAVTQLWFSDSSRCRLLIGICVSCC